MEIKFSVATLARTLFFKSLENSVAVLSSYKIFFENFAFAKCRCFLRDFLRILSPSRLVAGTTE